MAGISLVVGGAGFIGCHVASHIAGCVEVPGAANEVFNIGADDPVTVLELAHLIADEFGVPAEIKFLAPRQEVVHAFSSHEKARSVFGTDSKVSLREGIHRMAQWAKAIGPRRSPVFSAIEVSKNMPPSWKADLVRAQQQHQ